MTSQTHQPTQRVFTGWHMLAIMVAFFAVVISVNLFMAISATRSWTGLVVKNSYVASQEFNEKLANARAQSAMGWKGSLSHADDILTFTLVDGENTPLEAEKVLIDLSRPIGVTGDQTVTLSQQSNGSYQTVVPLASGAWNAVIKVTFTDQVSYEHRARLSLGSK